MSDGGNVVELVHPAKEPAHVQRPETERVPYLAVDTHRIHQHPPMFRLYHPSGLPEIIPYGLVLHIEMTTADNLDILLTTGGLFLKGKNLLANLKNPNDSEGLMTLLDALQVHRVWAFRCYNRELHLEPGDDEPVIHDIKFDTLNDQ